MLHFGHAGENRTEWLRQSGVDAMGRTSQLPAPSLDRLLAEGILLSLLNCPGGGSDAKNHTTAAGTFFCYFPVGCNRRSTCLSMTRLGALLPKAE